MLARVNDTTSDHDLGAVHAGCNYKGALAMVSQPSQLWISDFVKMGLTNNHANMVN